MYADRVEAENKRSIRDRLDGDLDGDFARGRPTTRKRQRQNDDKWRHDLYEDGEGPRNSKTKVGANDLRLKLQKKGSQQIYQGEKELGVQDLREKLSGAVQSRKESRVRDLREKLSGTMLGTMQSQHTKTDLPKAKPASESAKPAKRSAPSVDGTVPDTQKISMATSSKKKSQKRSDLSVDGLLQSLGLEKYSLMLQAEEVDMTALRHMTDEDLKALGIPMGPRKKMLLALDSKA